MATLSQIIREIAELSLPGKAIQSDVKPWVNRAQRAIAQERNWSFLHSITNVTMAANAFSVDLPVNFKELATGRSPITYIDPTMPNFPIPVNVMSRAELERLSPGFNSFVTNTPSGYGTPAYVFLEQNNGGRWTLNILNGFPILTSVTYAVACYLFPADLSAGTDSNSITNDADLCEALINWVRAKAYSAADPSDVRGGACMALYAQHLRKATSQDARKPISGRSVRM